MEKNYFSRLSSVASVGQISDLVDAYDAVRLLWGWYIAGTEPLSYLEHSAEALNVLEEFVDAMRNAHDEEEASRNK